MTSDQAASPALLPSPRGRIPALVSLGAGLASFAAYAATACRTITWWDGSSYPLAAFTLGIPSPPGSLLLTLLGWVASRIPLVHPVAFQLNLFAALMAAALVSVVTWLGIGIATPHDRAPGAGECFAGAVAGLGLAFGVSAWSYAVQFTPYILSALFTAVILAAALDWWRHAANADEPRRLFLLFLLFGLDFSVHRTNTLLLPAAVVWVALRRPGALFRPRGWGAIGAGLLLGLAFHLLLIPIAARDPGFDMEEPSSLARLWYYVSIGEKGGGFLVDLLPRKSDFLRVQLADYVAFLRRNLSPPGSWAWLIVPALLPLIGGIVAVARAARRTLGLLAFFLCSSLGAVIYFNLPAHYFRTMDRHYLPSLVILAPLAGVGASALIRLASRARAGVRLALASGACGLVLLGPVHSFATNRTTCDLSRTRFAETYSRDVIEPLDEGAFLMVQGDNDTFPLWYLQQVEGVRRDVTLVHLPLSNIGWYVAQLRRRDPSLSRLLEREKQTGLLKPSTNPDTLVTLPVEAGALTELPPSARAPRELTLHLPGTLYAEDRVVLDLLRLNRWRRPVYLATTVTRDYLQWLWPCARLDGLAWRIVPTTDPNAWDLEHLRRQLTEKVRYSGVADTTIAMDSDTRAMCGNYFYALFTLARAEAQRGDTAACLATLDFLDRHVPLKRTSWTDDPTPELRAAVKAQLPAETAKRR
jgi:hypothetical protein